MDQYGAQASERSPHLEPQIAIGLVTLRRLTWWAPAVGELADLNDAHGADAERNAADLVATYRDQVPSMVVDVVTSRQRRYDTRVRQLVAQFKEHGGRAVSSLQWLGQDGSGLGGLMSGEDETIKGVANGILDAGRQAGARSDREALDAWRESTDGLEIAHSLDPHVGAVKGIGMALFSYLRMRAGANTIKVDVRVKKSLRSLGFEIPNSDIATFLIAGLAAREVGMSLVHLDQLLWFLDT